MSDFILKMLCSEQKRIDNFIRIMYNLKYKKKNNGRYSAVITIDERCHLMKKMSKFLLFALALVIFTTACGAQAGPESFDMDLGGGTGETVDLDGFEMI